MKYDTLLAQQGELQEDYEIFTDTAEAIVPKVKGDESLAECATELGRDEAKGMIKEIRDKAKEVGSLGTKMKGKRYASFAKGLIDYQKNIDNALDKLGKKTEKRLDAVRDWADMCYDEMKTDKWSPVMTGNLRDNIKIMGNSWVDIDVDVWAEGIAKAGQNRKTMPNLRPYYDGRAPGTVKIALRPYDYSVYANESARPYDGNELVFFRYPKWETEIKLPKARQLGFDYEVKWAQKG